MSSEVLQRLTEADRGLARTVLLSGAIAAGDLQRAAETIESLRALGRTADLGDVLVEMGLCGAVDLARAKSRTLRAETCPDRIGPFEILEELGRGGMGIVWKARDPVLGRVVAVKRLLAASVSPGDEERFLREARAAARLRHPGIVRILDVGIDGDFPWFATEFVEGSSLDRLMAEGLDTRRGVEIVRQIAEALAYAHENGIVHRDVKPENVLVDAAGRARVVDFGLAKDARGAGGLTDTGIVLGTPKYMAPEQVRADTVSIGAPTDQFALGIILHEILAGEPYYRGGTVAAILLEVLQKEPVPPSEVDPGVPAWLDEICLRMLARDPEERYPDLRAVAAALAARPRGRRGGRSREATRPDVPWLPIAGAIAIVAGFAGGWTLLRDDPPPDAAAEDDVAEPDPPEAPAPDVAALLAPIEADLAAAREELYRRSPDAAARTAALERAETAAREVVAASPASSRAHLVLGEVLADRGRMGPAEESLRRAVALDARDASVREALGWVLLLRAWLARDTSGGEDPPLVRDRLRAAASELERALSLGFGEGDPLLAEMVRVHVDYARGKEAEVLEFARRKLQDLAGRRGAERTFWVCALASPVPDRIPLCESALALCPGYAPALVFRGINRLGVDARGAIADFTAATLLQPGTMQYRNNLAVLYFKVGDGTTALVHAEIAVAAEPEDPLFRSSRAAARYGTGDLAGAIEDYDAAMRLAPSYPSYPLNKAKMLFAMKRYDATLEALEVALRLRPGWSEALRCRAAVQAARGDTETALATIAEAIQSAPTDPQLRADRASLFIARRSWDEAVVDLGEAIRLGGRTAAVYSARGQCHAQRGDLEAAQSDLETALGLATDPTDRAKIELLLAGVRKRRGN